MIRILSLWPSFLSTRRAVPRSHPVQPLARLSHGLYVPRDSRCSQTDLAAWRLLLPPSACFTSLTQELLTNHPLRLPGEPFASTFWLDGGAAACSSDHVQGDRRAFGCRGLCSRVGVDHVAKSGPIDADRLHLDLEAGLPHRLPGRG